MLLPWIVSFPTVYHMPDHAHYDKGAEEDVSEKIVFDEHGVPFLETEAYRKSRQDTVDTAEKDCCDD